jgi:hypothetical protein
MADNKSSLVAFNVSDLLAAAFAVARQKQTPLHEVWIRISFRLGGMLPNSLLPVSVQREGEVDLVLRCLEDEMVHRIGSDQTENLWAGQNLNSLSVYWIGGVYEILRLLKSRNFLKGDHFDALFTDFELLRMPLEKHEIAKDKSLKEPLHLIKFPQHNNSADYYAYDPKDKTRAHIMSMGVSSRGSMMWNVTDLKHTRNFWIERRSLSDRVIELWGQP